MSAPDPARPPVATAAPPVLEIEARDPWGLAVRIVVVAVAIVLALWLAYELLAIVMQLVAATILATGLRPLVQRLHRGGLPRGIAVLLIYLALIVALVLFGVAIIPPIVNAISDVLANADAYGDIALNTLHAVQAQFPFLPPLDAPIAEQIRGLGSQIGAIASQALVVAQFALGVFGGLVTTVLTLLITLYLIVDGDRIRDYFLGFFAPQQHARLRTVTDRMGERMGGWLLGQLVLSAVMGVCVFVGLTIIGVPGAVLLALIAAIGEAIPILGPILSAIPAILVAATVSPLAALATLILFVVLQQLENNLLVPKIMERAVALHPLAVVLSLLVGGELLGIGGAVLAVPVAAALAAALGEVRQMRQEAHTDPSPPALQAQSAMLDRRASEPG